MPSLSSLSERLGDAVDALYGGRFDPDLVGSSFIDMGPQLDRARIIADRLNAVREKAPKQPVLLWTSGYAAVTRRGRWIYVARGLAERLSDDALAFVLAHEMAHHDLHHLTPMYVSAGLLGNWQRMELAADRHGLSLARSAKFDPRGALEALDPDRWAGDEPEPADALEGWPPALRAYVDRFRKSHPPLPERRMAIEAVLRG